MCDNEGFSDGLDSSEMSGTSETTDSNDNAFEGLDSVPETQIDESECVNNTEINWDELPAKVEDASLGSDFQAENNAIYEQFKEDYEGGTVKLVEPEEGAIEKEVNAQDIVGVRYEDDVSEEEFWAHHGNSKEDFEELVSKVPEVKNQLEEGKSLEEIKEDENLRATAEQYFDENNMVRVYEDGEKYIFDGDGRHRVTIAQEYGQDIPVKIIREVKDNE